MKVQCETQFRATVVGWGGREGPMLVIRKRVSSDDAGSSPARLSIALLHIQQYSSIASALSVSASLQMKNKQSKMPH